MFMDVRASDAERDQAVDRLREAAAEGRLTFEELADRIELAANAVTRAELVPLTADLPTALTLQPAEPIRVRMSGDIKRSGAWVVPPESSFRSYFGHVKLDLREATITAQEIRIDAFTPFGNIDLLVPEGVHVDVRAAAKLGKLKQETSAASPGAPRIVLTGGTWFGNVKIRHKRLWERLLKGG
jgi:DUF1707 SHOCT-like domain/Cell wall-active antibiotics response LiaF, C-terminal